MRTRHLKILIGDDHTLFRQALRELIKTFKFSAEILEAANGIEVLQVLSHYPIDVILLDIQMPHMNGLEAIRQIRNSGTGNVRIIIMTQFQEASLISHALELGANGYLLKNCKSDELERAILSAETIEQTGNDREEQLNLHISKREYDVLNLMANDESNKGIADRLGITLRTVESYRKNLLKKTRRRNTADLISLAYRTGLLSP